MERSLELSLLSSALDGRTGLPTAEELQGLMADVEVRLLLREPQITQELIETAWYLHGIASVQGARERYSPVRQRQAFQVSAHIFDLALTQPGWSSTERLSFGFAAAIGYRRGGRDPNATAILNRLRDDIHVDSPVIDHMASLSLEIGLAFLGFDTKTLFRWMGTWRRQLAALAADSELPDLRSTAFGPTHLVLLGTEDLLSYLARGNAQRLDRGLTTLRTVATGEAGPGDLNARWVAAHLLNFAIEAQSGSLWNPQVLPPTVSPLVRQAFTVGSPPVLTLWEPQRELLTGPQTPFTPDVRRMVLAVPTSGGKTLIAQLLALEHLARTDRSICYVTPTRSLGREVRRAMAGRVRILQKETGGERPDYPSLWDLLSSISVGIEPADVEVMTPERLGHLLRHDEKAVLSQFGMFIFDEAQLLKESGRGFVLESVIAMLDHLTQSTDHQIVLISAAMGNAGAIAQWLSNGDEPLLQESQWRGPRRLHAVFNTSAQWATTRIDDGAGRVWKYRHTTELKGQIRLRLANGRTAELTTREDTGWRLVRKSKDGALFSKEIKIDSEKTSKQYIIASEMIAALGHAGSVLVVASTKAEAQRLAKGLAASCGEQPSLAPLVDFVRQQLSDDHPLVEVLRHGVGFHHAGLPVEVLEALETAVRDDILPYLTCTSTLTDGVNLPVRTVVLYDQGYPGQPEDTRLRGARLVNAMGRAGRAGKETEGWIVLIRATEAAEQDFRDLNPDADDLAVTSSLLTETALDSFAELEGQIRETEDAVYKARGAASDFVSFVWLMLAMAEGNDVDPGGIDTDSIVDATLAAAQSSEARQRCLRVAKATHQAYLAADSKARRRWPRTGTSIGSAQLMDKLASELAAVILAEEPPVDLHLPGPTLDLLSDRFGQLLELVEAPRWRFRVSRQGSELDVRPEELLRDWISGLTLTELSERHLGDVTDAAWRIEQMVSAIAEHFEHYLAWIVSALIELVNHHLEEATADTRLCPELGGYIRYGVDSVLALQLMTSGIRSRRIAHSVVADVPEDLPPAREDLRSWLAAMTISEWRDRYRATSSEVLDLLDFTRLRNRSLLKTLLETGRVSVNIATTGQVRSDYPLSLVSVPDEPTPAPLAIYAADQLVALIAAEDHADVQAILDTGLGIDLSVEATDDQSAILHVALPLKDG